MTYPRDFGRRTAGEAGDGVISTEMVVREVLDSGLRLITETMPHVRSVTIGVWLTRGSRHETDERGGIAHFVEHMLFKGTDTRSAEDIAQAIDSIGGQLDAFTAKEYASYYIKVLDEHLPLAVDLLADIVLRPAFVADEIERERRSSSKRSRWSRTRPTISSTSSSPQHSGKGIRSAVRFSAPKETVEALTQQTLRDYFRGAYVAPNVIVSAAGNLDHARVRELIEKAFGELPAAGEPLVEEAPQVSPAGDHRAPRSSSRATSASAPALSAEPRRPLRQLHPEHGARRVDELAAVPEHPREARSRVFGVQRPQRLPRCRQHHHLRRLRQRSRRRGHRPRASRS